MSLQKCNLCLGTCVTYVVVLFCYLCLGCVPMLRVQVKERCFNRGVANGCDEWAHFLAFLTRFFGVRQKVPKK